MDTDFPRLSEKTRFAGDALTEGPALTNPQMGLIDSPASIRNAQKPGGNLVSTRTEKFFERPA